MSLTTTPQDRESGREDEARGDGASTIEATTTEAPVAEMTISKETEAPDSSSTTAAPPTLYAAQTEPPRIQVIKEGDAERRVALSRFSVDATEQSYSPTGQSSSPMGPSDSPIDPNDTVQGPSSSAMNPVDSPKDESLSKNPKQSPMGQSTSPVQSPSTTEGLAHDNADVSPTTAPNAVPDDGGDDAGSQQTRGPSSDEISADEATRMTATPGEMAVTNVVGTPKPEGHDGAETTFVASEPA